MTVTSIYPVICTDRVAETHAFYTQHFGFEAVFDADWYVSLSRPGPPSYELALLDYTHPTLPESYRKPVQGVLINIEVADVDAEWERLVVNGGLTAVLQIRSEDFGQRHFIVADPNGVLVDVITPIEPTGEFADSYGES